MTGILLGKGLHTGNAGHINFATTVLATMPKRIVQLWWKSSRGPPDSWEQMASIRRTFSATFPQFSGLAHPRLPQSPARASELWSA